MIFGRSSGLVHKSRRQRISVPLWKQLQKPAQGYLAMAVLVFFARVHLGDRLATAQVDEQRIVAKATRSPAAFADSPLPEALGKQR